MKFKDSAVALRRWAQGRKTKAQVVSSDPTETFEDDSEHKNRRNARKRHRLRFRTQFFVWGALFALTATNHILQSALAGFDESQCHQNELSCIQQPFYVYAAVVTIFTIIICVSSSIFNHNHRNDWNVALKSAQAILNTENIAEGYTDLFRIYVQTKRRSYQLLGYAIFALISFAISAFVLSESNLISVAIADPSIVAFSLFYMVLMFILLRLSYKLGSSYIPGPVIVRHTLVLALFAASDPQDLVEARNQIEVSTEDFRKRNPWWFYPG